ncbi:MAG: O-antigen ligase family protein [Chloroflexi bacterium]|nr:O-antigen ligase family protein [Chloroflexota bacterium]
MLLWAAAAVLTGVVVAILPPAVAFTGFALVALALLAAVTPLAALIALLVLAPLRTLIATESALQLPLDIGQLAFAALIAAWAAYRIARGESLLSLVYTPVMTAILLLLVVFALTAFNAASIGAWLNEWLKWLQILLLLLLAHDMAGDHLWHWLVFGLVLAGLANGLVGLYEFWGGSGALHLLISSRFFRAFGTFGQPNPFGGFMGLLAPVAIMAAVGYGRRAWSRWRIRHHLPISTVLLTLFYAAAAIVMVVGIFASWSRGAWLAFGMALGVLVLAFPQRAWRGLMIAAISTTLVALLWLTGFLPASVTERISSSTAEFFAFEDVRGVDITPENYAVVERLAHWQAALNMTSTHPWLGVGLGNYEVVYPQYRLLNWIEPLGHAHNYYLNILAEAGIIGLLGYGKAWVLIMWTNWRARRHPDFLAHCILVGLLGTWTYLGVHSLFDNLYVNNLFLHLGLMLGVLAILYNQTRRYTRLGVP